MKTKAVNIHVFGVVQGVGFRPFIYRIAKKLGYKGWVKNIGFGVEIHLEANEESDFSDFLESFEREKPPLALIEEFNLEQAPFQKAEDFTIKKTEAGEKFVFISPDISMCDNCRRELHDPSDRRYHYPFINCTDCGPRYTIVKALPYDRPQTTMDKFEMCEDCRKEYTDPLDRRYHAQPIACPVCGPQVSLRSASREPEIAGGIPEAAALIKDGKILGVKGLGGFHLICDALNPKAVQRLRKIKERQTKPLALMARSISVIEKYAHITPAEREYLLSVRKPIVLLKKKQDIPAIAPYLNEIGFMLPYTPLHELLLEDIDLIVATSSNKKDSPIMKDEQEGIEALCDYILTHNRPIHMRADDSVLKIVVGKPLFLRRARGYVPYPQKVHENLRDSRQILALGGELKDTVSVYKNGYVVTSQFLGDLDEYQNFIYFEETITHLTHLFDIKPDLVVTDLHPDFHTTRYAQKMGIPHIQVQHHFAHTLAPLLEHGYSGSKKVLGVSLDGFGYGEDKTAWGGEFLLADYSGYSRLAHFKNIPLPGGDLAAKHPWRMAAAYLFDCFGSEFPLTPAMKSLDPKKVKGVIEMIRRGLNCPPSSSCGRLFDAVSFLTGLSPNEVEFEAEAPMRLEAAAADGIRGSYEFDILEEKPNSPKIISFTPMIRSLLEDIDKGQPPGSISAKFHNTLSRVILYMALYAREKYQIDTLSLSGGVFLNRRLLQTTEQLLEDKGFKVLRTIYYSPNDESVSIGQIAYALGKKAEERRFKIRI